MSAQDKPSGSGLLRWAPLLAIAAGVALVFSMGWHKYLTFEQLKAQRETLTAFVAAHPAQAVAGFVALYAVCTLLMVPGSWVTIAGGFLFGLALGAAATVIGATIGASLLFLAARTSLGEVLRARAGPFLKTLEAGFARNAFSYMFTLRFLPVVPFAVANIAPALLGARFRDFFVTTLFGIIPATVAYTWIGSGLGASFDSGGTPNLAGFARELAPAFVALAAVSLAPALIQRLRKDKPA